MQTLLYQAADIFFIVFHTVLILFNSFGWAIRRFRKYNLFTLMATVFSWFVLGIWYGWGYCVCTDWHWSVRDHLGYTTESNSYISFLIIKLTGIKFPESLVDQAAIIVLVSSIILSVTFNVRDWRKKGSGD